MSWLGKLFGTDKAAEKLLDTGKQLLDDAFYTEAERAESAAQDRSEVRKMLVEWMANTQGQNLSRRIIALSITGFWLLMHVISTAMVVSAVWVEQATNDKLSFSSQILDERIDGMTAAVMLILGFYFAAPYMGDIAKGALQRMQK